MDSKRTDHRSTRLAMIWVEVTDAAGHTRLESRWSAPEHASSAPHAA